MIVRYVELRKIAARGTDSIAADIMRHLHTRQHLGKAAVITNQPAASLAAGRKQWLKLTRALQKQRASTLHADKILKYTHSITHMQHMQFTTKGAIEYPDADVYFMDLDQLYVLPTNCWTVYLLHETPHKDTQAMLYQLPPEALIVDYVHKTSWEKTFGLLPKAALESRVDAEWRQVRQFLHDHKIDAADLADSDAQHAAAAMDDALDTLLGVSFKFLQVAGSFQHVLERARPLHIDTSQRAYYDALTILAHRVQALSPGIYSQQFLETYNEDDTFFLYDHTNTTVQRAMEAWQYHMQAGRYRLAAALRAAAATPGLRRPAGLQARSRQSAIG
jgi:hypothetical protein